MTDAATEPVLVVDRPGDSDRGLVTYLRLEVVGARSVLIIGNVDLTGDDVESHLAVRLRTLEDKIRASPAVAGAVLSLSAPDEPSLTV